MALYYDLPVYKVSYDLLIQLYTCIRHCNREYKYTLGENIKHEAIELIKNIHRANSTSEKYETLATARERLELIRLFVRILKDLCQINTATVVELNEKIESISKQLTAWQRTSKKTQYPEKATC